MIIDLSKLEFSNDFARFDLPSGGALILNNVNEVIALENEAESISMINLQIEYRDGRHVKCPSVIGLGNDLIKIITEYSEYKGTVLNSDNMRFCSIEVYE